MDSQMTAATENMTFRLEIDKDLMKSVPKFHIGKGTDNSMRDNLDSCSMMIEGDQFLVGYSNYFRLLELMRKAILSIIQASRLDALTR
jgi:hypothetical protein